MDRQSRKQDMEKIAGSWRSMHGYILTHSSLERANIYVSSGLSTEGTLISASTVPGHGWKIVCADGRNNNNNNNNNNNKKKWPPSLIEELYL